MPELPTAPPARTVHIVAPAARVPGGGEVLHELRVRIPVDLHRQLMSIKILRGKSLAETVATALDAYFAEVAQNAAKPRR